VRDGLPWGALAKAASASPVTWETALLGGLVTTLVTVLALILRSIVKGDLVPRSVLADEKERADKWEAAWRESEARNDAFDGRLQAIAEGTELGNQLLSQLMMRAQR
jgi:hypothetical protein